MQEPAATFYMQEYTKPERTLDITPGHWRNDATFPPAEANELTFYLGEGGVLAEQPAAMPKRSHDDFAYLPTVGLANGYWSAGGMSFYLADDQRADEAYSLVYTSPPLKEATRLLGWPRVVLHGSSTAQVATFVAKLADVAPDGSSALIVDGSLNGTRRQSLTDPQPMKPEEIYELNVPMMPTGWVLKPGHRLRLAISGADFPNLWPTPEKARLSVYRDAKRPSRVILPVVPESKLAPPDFLPPPILPVILKSYGTAPSQQVIHDQLTGAVTVVNRRASSLVLQYNMGTVHTASNFRCTASSKDPAQASIVGTHTYTLEREDGTIEVTAESTIRATATAFHISIDLNVTRNGKPFFSRKWMVTEPRRLL
jgi:hypothetical protein